MRRVALLTVLLAGVVAPIARAERTSQAPAARNRAGDPRLTLVDDEPMSQLAARAPTTAQHRADPSDPLDRGTRREVVLEAPALEPTCTEPAPTRERTVAAPAPAPPGGEPLSGAADVLAAHQMRRNQPSIDACLAAAVGRSPAAAGTVTLIVDVHERKVREVRVALDDVHDLELDACLLRAGRGWSFSLGHAVFVWPVTLSPTASR